MSWNQPLGLSVIPEAVQERRFFKAYESPGHRLARYDIEPGAFPHLPAKGIITFLQ